MSVSAERRVVSIKARSPAAIEIEIDGRRITLPVTPPPETVGRENPTPPVVFRLIRQGDEIGSLELPVGEEPGSARTFDATQGVDTIEIDASKRPDVDADSFVASPDAKAFPVALRSRRR